MDRCYDGSLEKEQHNTTTAISRFCTTNGFPLPRSATPDNPSDDAVTEPL